MTTDNTRQPDLWQFMNSAGQWVDFDNEQHRLDTIADGRRHIRAFCTTLQPVIAPWVMLTDNEIELCDASTLGCQHFGRAIQAAFIAKQGAKA